MAEEKDQLYDHNDNLIYYRTPEGKIRRFAYDDQDRLIWYQEEPEGYSEWRLYNGRYAIFHTNDHFCRFVEVNEKGHEIREISQKQYEERCLEQCGPRTFRFELMDI